MYSPDYNSATARHYARWRPPLHACILATGFCPGERFARGLDVGCGTGQSTHALARYCDEVVGIDPAPEMIELALPGENISFTSTTLEQLSPSAGFSVATFAGCLHYLDPAQTLHHLRRHVDGEAVVIVYDFDVRLADYFRCLGYRPEPEDYDHGACFASLEDQFFRREKTITRGMSFPASDEQLAHLLLSLRPFREWAAEHFDDERPHGKLREKLHTLVSCRHQLSAKTYLTRYALKV